MNINLEQIQVFFKEYFTISFLLSFLSLAGIILVIYIFFKILIKWLGKFTANKLSPEIQSLVKKILHYICTVVILLTIFKHIGINISAFIGAAGIAGIAIGFAAQTSVANIISGFFVLAEKAFKVGDRIQLNDITGYVAAIEFMAIKVKTLDGHIVRIPNETIIKGNLINFSANPTRRVEIKVNVAYGTDLEMAEKILMQIPEMIPQVLKEPEPFVVWTAYANSGIEISIYLWGKNEDFLLIKNTAFKMINTSFAEAKITIPFPQMDIHIKQKTTAASSETSDLLNNF